VTELVIVIVSYNARRDLDACLASLRQAAPGTSHAIVVVDNASTDGSTDMLREKWPAVKVIDAGGNLGFARANNMGIRAVATDLILLLNSDTIVPPGAIDTLVAELKANPDVAGVGPRLVDPAGQPEISFGSMITPLNELCRKTAGWLYRHSAPGAPAWVRRRVSRVRYPDWVSGACLLVRRTDAEAAGLLDERFFLYAEDVDFCASIRALGRRIMFSPAIEVIHLRGRSVRHAPAVAERLYRLSQLAFYDKHHPRWVPWLRRYLRVRGKLPSRAP
jgi:N-acetylglucosaminyl-diphospho-decaprenol L-rhamnosyltransferase